MMYTRKHIEIKCIQYTNTDRFGFITYFSDELSLSTNYITIGA